MSRLDWGSVPDWLAGIGTVLGVFFAGWQIRLSRISQDLEAQRERDADISNRQAMARSVGVRVTLDAMTGSPRTWTGTYDVVNRGQQPISGAVLVIADPFVADCDPTLQRGTAYELVLGTVLPGEAITDSLSVTFSEDPVFGQLAGLGGLIFTDAWGQTWWTKGAALEALPGAARVC